MKNIEIVGYKDYIWGSLVQVKIEGTKDYMINAKIGIVVGSLAMVSIISALVGFALSRLL